MYPPSVLDQPQRSASWLVRGREFLNQGRKHPQCATDDDSAIFRLQHWVLKTPSEGSKWTARRTHTFIDSITGNSFLRQVAVDAVAVDVEVEAAAAVDAAVSSSALKPKECVCKPFAGPAV